MNIEHQIRLLQGYTPYPEPQEDKWPLWQAFIPITLASACLAIAAGYCLYRVWSVIAAGYWLVG